MNNYQYIKDALDKQNRSISWLAKEIGVSKGYVSKLLNNKVSEPGNTKIQAIHNALDIQDITDYQKNAYLIDVDYLSIEKYVYVATKCIKESYDIYILINSKTIHKQINLKRFYDYLNFSSSRVFLVNESELKKALSKNSYTDIIAFNGEFDFLKGYDIVNEELANENVLQLRDIRNKSVLVLSNNANKLSILLNVLKLKTDYLIDDFSIFNEANEKSNSIITNQLHILEEIYRSCQGSRYYVIGNEYLYLQQDEDFNEIKNGLININEYLELFDVIFTIDFKENNDYNKQITQRNNKVIKLIKANHISLENNDILKLADEIIKYVKEH